MPKRNSNNGEWLKFCKTLEKKKFKILIVPDNDGDTVCEEFSSLESVFVVPNYFLDAAHRLAIYESCMINLNVNNGPSALCWLCPQVNYLTFKMITKGVPQTEPDALSRRGFVLYENLSFANKFQNWVWKEDLYDIISEELKNFLLTYDSDCDKPQ